MYRAFSPFPCGDCPPNTMRCKGTHQCFESSGLCNSIQNCGDKSDEECASCPPDRPFKCKYNGKTTSCIKQSEVCDCFDNCLGRSKSDEEHCFICNAYWKNKRRNVHCLKSDKWIAEDSVCDGKIDCDYSEDEHLCANQCPAWKPVHCKGNATICIKNKEVCDGKSDCPDGDDEENCEICPTNYFKCDNTTTKCKLPIRYVCDGEYHCANGRDEEVCSTCPNDGFKCEGTTKCIDKVQPKTINIVKCKFMISLLMSLHDLTT